MLARYKVSTAHFGIKLVNENAAKELWFYRPTRTCKSSPKYFAVREREWIVLRYVAANNSIQ